MDAITAKNAYYIKLGKKNSGWVEECIEKDNNIKIGFRNPLHTECLNREWEKIRKYWIDEGKKNGKATEFTNQIKTFYESGEDTLWITFFKRRLYWCFAKTNIEEQEDGYRIRKVIGEWRDCNINGVPLEIESLSGKLTKVQGFQGTICGVKEFDYLLHKINDEKLNEVEKVKDTLFKLKIELEPIIQNLTWKDFELLIDLVFSYAGWQRVSSLGKTEEAIDLVLMSPVNGNRAFVQIKSESNNATFETYVKKFREMDQYDEMYFVVHTMTKPFISKEARDIKLWDVKKISELVVNSGLVNWVINKAI